MRVFYNLEALSELILHYFFQSYYTINNFTVMRSKITQLPRPQTMIQKRKKLTNLSHSNKFLSNRNNQQQEENCDRYEKQYISIRNNNDNQFVYVVIPNNKTETNNIQVNSQRKTNVYSRQNMQLINKKNRDIRSSKFGQSTGIYDFRNYTRYIPTRTSSAMTEYIDHAVQQAEIQPIIKMVAKPNNLKNTKTVKISRNLVLKSEGSKQIQNQQCILRSKSTLDNKKKYTINKSKQTANKAQKYIPPQKISGNGLVLNKFESKLKKKCIEDNLNVMAMLLKRKMKVMQKQDMVIYLKKFMSRNSVQQ